MTRYLTPGFLASGWSCLALALLLAAGCGARSDPSDLQPSTILLQLPAQSGTAEREPVPFPHARHTDALAQDGCRKCHGARADGTLIIAVTSPEPGEDKDTFMHRAHGLCMGCHEQSLKQSAKAGPVTCGGCHRQAAAAPTPASATMTSVLHGKHVEAMKEECKQCHHVLDPKTQQLRYEKGKEHACGSCHGATDEGRTLSARHAAHRSCVGCHERKGLQQEKTGPLACSGCHGWTAKPEEKAKALQHERPATVWVVAEGATYPAVGFHHETHEAQAPFCTTCHHSKLDACDSCHGVHGKKEGQGITLYQAHHDPASQRSCVGCHASQAAKPSCKGCHGMTEKAPQAASCKVCHNGPAAGTPLNDVPVPAAQKVALQPLPAYGPDFPETIRIDGGTGEYAAADYPHGRVVAKLHALVADSGLAAAFHGNTEVLCAGCHHHSPVGQRPPGCASCHGDHALPGRDQPGLKAAYHRQCLGCHERMQLKSVGCTDCHQKAVAEKSR